MFEKCSRFSRFFKWWNVWCLKNWFTILNIFTAHMPYFTLPSQKSAHRSHLKACINFPKYFISMVYVCSKYKYMFSLLIINFWKRISSADRFSLDKVKTIEKNKNINTFFQTIGGNSYISVLICSSNSEISRPSLMNYWRYWHNTHN